MFKKWHYVIILLCCFAVVSCAGPINRACKDLSKAGRQLSDAVIIAQVANETNPELVTEKNVQDLVLLRDTIMGLAGTACLLDAVIPLDVK